MRATQDVQSGRWVRVLVALIIAGPVLLIPSVAAADRGSNPGTSVSPEDHRSGDEHQGGGPGRGSGKGGRPGHDDAHRMPAPATSAAPHAAPPVTVTPTTSPPRPAITSPAHPATTVAVRPSARRTAPATSPAAAVPPVTPARSAAAGKVASAGPGGPGGPSALLASAVAAGVLVFVLGLLAAGARTLARMKSVEQ